MDKLTLEVIVTIVADFTLTEVKCAKPMTQTYAHSDGKSKKCETFW